MATKSDRSPVEAAVKGGVEMALDTSLREPILEAVEENQSTEQEDTDNSGRFGRIKRLIGVAAILAIIAGIVRRIRRSA